MKKDNQKTTEEKINEETVPESEATADDAATQTEETATSEENTAESAEEAAQEPTPEQQIADLQKEECGINIEFVQKMHILLLMEKYT